ncbi:MAG: Type 1 glutamine amidotransferase-like domain-containing protein [Candidatus Berkelbacteria bacterium]
MQTILLTSAGMRVKEEILKLLPRPANQINLAYITTAIKPEANKAYAENDRKLLEEAGFNIEDVDIEGQDEKSLFKLLRNFNIIYVQGGNTFYLLKAVHDSGFDKVAKELIDQGVIYIGVSAGSMICGPLIETADWKKPDKNKINLQDLTGMNLVPFNLFVHYEDKWKDTVKEKSKQSLFSIKVLTDDQAILVRGDKTELVGQEPQIIL